MQEKSPALDKAQPRGLGDQAAPPRRKSPTVRGHTQPVYQNVRVERKSSHSGEKRVLERKVSHPGEKRVLERKVSNPRDIKKSSGTSGQARAKGRVRRNRSTQEKGTRRLDQTPSRKVVTRMGLQEQEIRRQEQENLLERVARKHSLRNDSLMSPHKVGRRSNGRIGSRR